MGMITSCCQLAAVTDTRLLLDRAHSVAPGTLFCTLGCHPHNYRQYNDIFEMNLLQELEINCRHVVALGECGLDYCKNRAESAVEAERAKMIEVFARQARLAAARRLPLVVHSRDAEEDTVKVLRDYLPAEHKVYIHAYQGSVATMNTI